MMSAEKHKSFRNEKPLKLQPSVENLKTLDLSLFPLVEDFEVSAERHGKKHPKVRLYYKSATFGILAHPSWWSWDAGERLIKMTSDEIPRGEIDKPFYDADQGWQVYIFEKRDYVYIMQGKDPSTDEFYTWFRVLKSKYIEEWEKLLQHVHDGIMINDRNEVLN